MTKNRQIILAARPEGLPKPSDFRLVETEVPTPQEGQILVKIAYLSVDPYMRGRISEAKSYAEPVALGQVMVGGTVGTVAESRHPDYQPGDLVVGYSGWQEYALSIAAPGVLGNDWDPDGDALSAVLVAGPSHGTLDLNKDGSFTYAPADSYSGTDSFTYKANDGALDSNGADRFSYKVTALPPATLGRIVRWNGTTVKVNTAYTLKQIRGMKFKTAAGGITGSGTFSYTVTDNGWSNRGGSNGQPDPQTLTQSLTVRVTSTSLSSTSVASTSGGVDVRRARAAAVAKATQSARRTAAQTWHDALARRLAARADAALADSARAASALVFRPSTPAGSSGR